MIRYVFVFLLLFSLLNGSEITVDLKKPSMRGKVFSTTDGGVLKGEEIRIQAQHIEYVKDQYIKASGNLLVMYRGQIYVGTSIDYNLAKRSGIIEEGRTFAGLWYMGGERIFLYPDGSYEIEKAYVTTSASTDHAWEMAVQNLSISEKEVVTAKNLQLKVCDRPFFWFPWYQSSLKFLKDPPIRYNMKWDKALGPRLSARYRIYATENGNLYFRFDYRVGKGVGAAIETNYLSDDQRTKLITRSYGATNKSTPNQESTKQYRLQGIFHSHSANERSLVDITYDWLRDQKLPQNFRSEDFEVNTRKKTILRATHQEWDSQTSLRVQPRINGFQNLNQELPKGIIAIHPLPIPTTGIISENRITVGFNEYVFANELDGIIPNYQAGRLETQNGLYRPFHLGPLSLTPRAGIKLIYYSDSPCEGDEGQVIFDYGINTNAYLYKRYPSFRHTIEPYANFSSLAKPSIPLDQNFIFNINDGFFKLNLLRIGLRNLFTYPSSSISADLYTYAYLSSSAYDEPIPRLYANIDARLPSLFLNTYLVWNFEEQRLDTSNFRTKFTINEDFALYFEFRYRSKFAWRKSDYDNFVVDFARSLDDLLRSPLSDQRYTVLGRAELRLSPKWISRAQIHSGFGRKCEPGYTEYKFDLFRTLTSHWQTRLSYLHMPNDDRFTLGLRLTK